MSTTTTTQTRFWVCYEINPTNKLAYQDSDWSLYSDYDDAFAEAEAWTMMPFVQDDIFEGHHVRIFIAKVNYDEATWEGDAWGNEVPGSRVVLLDKNNPANS